MNVFRQLKAEAEARARGALERVGINVPDLGIEDDEDTAERDVFAIYQDVLARREAMTYVDMPEEERSLWRERSLAMAAKNAEALANFEAWIGKRAAFAEAWNEKARPRDRFDYGFGHWDEFFKIASWHGLVASYDKSWRFDDFEQALYALAEMKRLPYANLLVQACRKLALSDDLGLESWLSMLNLRIEAFGIAVERLTQVSEKVYLSLVVL